MKDDLFADLLASAEEMVEIEKGERAPNPVHVHSYSTLDVKAIRESAGISRRELAQLLCVSYESVSSWENKRRNPSGLTRKVLNMIQHNPKHMIEELGATEA